ncbi:hypothetical protein NL676_033093 [Syzygium grande]|nr:hypothetical protein NL676_033093 [Syzygium grande]
MRVMGVVVVVVVRLSCPWRVMGAAGAAEDPATVRAGVPACGGEAPEAAHASNGGSGEAEVAPEGDGAAGAAEAAAALPGVPAHGGGGPEAARAGAAGRQDRGGGDEGRVGDAWGYCEN